MGDVALWWATAVWFAAKAAWDELPGPWWVKLLLIAVTQAIPGGADEFLLFGGIRAGRWFWRRYGAAIRFWIIWHTVPLHDLYQDICVTAGGLPWGS